LVPTRPMKSRPKGVVVAGVAENAGWFVPKEIRIQKTLPNEGHVVAFL